MQTLCYSLLLHLIITDLYRTIWTRAYVVKSAFSTRLRPTRTTSVLYPIRLTDRLSSCTNTITSPTTRARYELNSRIKSDDDELFQNDDAFDVEAVRKRLEALVASGGDASSETRTERSRWESSLSHSRTLTPVSLQDLFSGIDIKFQNVNIENVSEITKLFSLSSAPLMTSLRRMRKEAEIKLLMQLEFGDESLSELWDLWFNERGTKAAKMLKDADELSGQGPDGILKAETILLELIREHGIHFSEPLNRLATLYYIQGHLRESLILWMIVISSKPWHFGALSGLVKVHADLKDSESALFWASQRLPPFATAGPNRRRSQWVRKSIDQARAQLSIAENKILEQLDFPVDKQNEIVVNSNGIITQRIVADGNSFFSESWQ